MTKNLDSDAIKLSGLRNTKSRSAILDVLERSAQPISAEQVFLELKKREYNCKYIYRL